MWNNNYSKSKITSRDENYAEWYLDIAKSSEMYENSPTPWCITFLPKAVDIWTNIKDNVSEILKMKWVQDIYLPLLIPMSFLEKEKDHVEWFAPELAVVTHAWWKELDENLVIRPTSETIFCDFFKKRLSSYRDLPMLYNQWVNVMRWEKRTRPFLRTAEFYWQEWHTLHETEDNAHDFISDIHNNVYIKVMKDVLAIDWISWEKSESERFAWALNTFTYEWMMSNWWALQMATSHMLSQWFMEQFDVSFMNKEWKKDYPFYTSWWLSTRLLWAMISSHSDDKWLVIPPRVSDYKAVILPIYWKNNSERINEYIKVVWEIITWWKHIVPVKWEQIKAQVSSESKVLIDYRDIRLWQKINDFEISWYPVRIDCWERDIDNNSVVISSRINWEKKIVELENIKEEIDIMLEEWQNILLNNSRKRLEENTIACYSIEEIWEVVWEGKFALYEWDWNVDFEKIIKDKYKATIRCIPFKGQFTDDLLEKKNEDNHIVILARNF